jgi:hypothetical protein
VRDARERIGAEIGHERRDAGVNLRIVAVPIASAETIGTFASSALGTIADHSLSVPFALAMSMRRFISA